MRDDRRKPQSDLQRARRQPHFIEALRFVNFSEALADALGIFQTY
jgi:hypothetical protein